MESATEPVPIGDAASSCVKPQQNEGEAASTSVAPATPDLPETVILAEARGWEAALVDLTAKCAGRPGPVEAALNSHFGLLDPAVELALKAAARSRPSRRGPSRRSREEAESREAKQAARLQAKQALKAEKVRKPADASTVWPTNCPRMRT